MLKILNKYEVLRTCDNCGRTKVVQKQRYYVLKKQEKHYCKKCLITINSLPSNKGIKHEVKSIYAGNGIDLLITWKNHRHKEME